MHQNSQVNSQSIASQFSSINLAKIHTIIASNPSIIKVIIPLRFFSTNLNKKKLKAKISFINKMKRRLKHNSQGLIYDNPQQTNREDDNKQKAL